MALAIGWAFSGSQQFQLVFHQRVETSFVYRSQPDGEDKIERMAIDERGFQNLSVKKKIDFYHHRGRLLDVSHADNGANINIWLVPYWSIVIPLSFISAWLLLSNPRKAKLEATEG